MYGDSEVVAHNMVAGWRGLQEQLADKHLPHCDHNVTLLLCALRSCNPHHQSGSAAVLQGQWSGVDITSLWQLTLLPVRSTTYHT